MDDGIMSDDHRRVALELLRELRQVDGRLGVKNSRIAFDVALLFYEGGSAEPRGLLSVDQIAAVSGYSGPTVRLVLRRLMEAGAIEASRRLGKTQLYAMTETGRGRFDDYVAAITRFRQR